MISLHETKIFCLSFDALGRLKRINWSNFARDSRIDLPLEEVEPLYRAMKEYDDILNDKDVCINYKMKPGEGINDTSLCSVPYVSPYHTDKLQNRYIGNYYYF